MPSSLGSLAIMALPLSLTSTEVLAVLMLLLAALLLALVPLLLLVLFPVLLLLAPPKIVSEPDDCDDMLRAFWAEPRMPSRLKLGVRCDLMPAVGDLRPPPLPPPPPLLPGEGMSSTKPLPSPRLFRLLVLMCEGITVEEDEEADEMDEKPCGSVVVIVSFADLVRNVGDVKDPIAEPGQSPTDKGDWMKARNKES